MVTKHTNLPAGRQGVTMDTKVVVTGTENKELSFAKIKFQNQKK